jgi:hypothetical protein
MAERLIRGRGIEGAIVRAVGLDGEIAAIRAPSECIGRLKELAPEVKALGFRYVAFDLAAVDERFEDDG